MLLYDSGYTPEKRRSFMFVSQHNISVLSEAPHIMMDATFSSSPNLFAQLFTVHGLYDSGWHMPLVYGLLPGKTQVLYTDFLAALDHLFPSATFEPQSVLCDFEKGLHNAIEIVWPDATVRGCYFHFKSSLWKKMQAFELVPEYKVLSSAVRKWFKSIGALPFAEPGSVVELWEDIKPQGSGAFRNE